MNWPKQYIFPVLIAALGILASIVAFTQVKSFDETERQNAFLHQADSHFSVVEDQILATQDMLTSLRAFVENNDTLKRSQFDQFSKALLQRHQ
ncbi:MAG: sodium/proton-translocating pyrophosphatase, partial [Proteobacteria bacterium]|nr:sodium/proton-translocating pyrophosphatase [Pseudomonadota bacterium]